MRVYTIFILIILSGAFLLNAAPDVSGKWNGQSSDKIEANVSEHSKTRHILFSLLLPGAGQWGMGAKNRAKFFLGTEVMLWMGFFGTNAYADILQKNYQSYAAVHAGTTTQNKDDQYWIDIGSTSNIFEFNEQQLRQRDIQALYSDENMYYWQWDSRDNQRYYNNLRVQEHDWERRATFIVGAFILNRIVSAADVIRLISKEKKQQRLQSYLSVSYTNSKIHNEQIQFKLNLSW